MPMMLRRFVSPCTETAILGASEDVAFVNRIPIRNVHCKSEVVVAVLGMP